MPKSLLIYEAAVPLSAATHGNVHVEPIERYAFAGELNAVPLMAIEFANASLEYPIVFTQVGDVVMPAAVLGLRNQQNVFVAADGRWDAAHVPAFIRRYPFVFSSSDDGQRLTLCIDEACPSVNRQERGSALFGAAGQPTAYLESVLAFTKEYQRQDGRTRALCRRLRDLGLLTPMQASAPMPSGEDVTLSGFLAVDRARVRDLDAASLQALARDDELEPLFLHLASLRNFERIKDRMVARAAETQAPAAVKRAAPRKRAKPRAP
jgi:hypothetical protein